MLKVLVELLKKTPLNITRLQDGYRNVYKSLQDGSHNVYKALAAIGVVWGGIGGGANLIDKFGMLKDKNAVQVLKQTYQDATGATVVEELQRVSHSSNDTGVKMRNFIEYLKARDEELMKIIIYNQVKNEQFLKNWTLKMGEMYQEILGVSQIEKESKEREWKSLPEGASAGAGESRNYNVHNVAGGNSSVPIDTQKVKVYEKVSAGAVNIGNSRFPANPQKVKIYEQVSAGAINIIPQKHQLPSETGVSSVAEESENLAEGTSVGAGESRKQNVAGDGITRFPVVYEEVSAAVNIIPQKGELPTGVSSEYISSKYTFDVMADGNVRVKVVSSDQK